jgi:tripartite-type tricarboxylate transporter receptor subunit TctC
MAMRSRSSVYWSIIPPGSTIFEKEMLMLNRRAFIAFLAASPFASQTGMAQARYPDQPIKLIVPFGAGGGADITARVVGEKLGQRLGQQVVVVNQPGAGGTAAARAALSASPDGHTLALLTNGTAVSAAFLKNLGFDPVKDFLPVSSLGFFDFMAITGADQPYKTLADVLAAMKSKPGTLNVGTINLGSTQHLSAVLLKSLAKVDFAIVPFRTSPDALTAAMRRDVDIIIDGYAAAGALIRDGKLRALASSGAVRSPLTPDVPTMIESGVAGFDVTSWNAVFAPVGTPPAVVEMLNREIMAVLADPDVKNRLLAVAIEARGASPTEIGDKLKADIARWSGVIKDAGIERQ